MMVRGSEPSVDNRHRLIGTRKRQRCRFTFYQESGSSTWHLTCSYRPSCSPILRYCHGRPSARFTTTTSTIYISDGAPDLRQRRCNGGTFAPIRPNTQKFSAKTARQLGPRTGRFVHHSPPDKLSARARALALLLEILS
jgi:hypothetical protein